jgi:transcriptional regulator with XRE-family HTH domain
MTKKDTLRIGGKLMNSTFKNIGFRIKTLRERSSFSQSNIAKYLKVDQSFISKIESGERSLSTDMLDKLTALFGVDLTAFEDSCISLDKNLTFAFRASEIADQDLEAISAINQIALNCNFMTTLLEIEAKNG